MKVWSIIYWIKRKFTIPSQSIVKLDSEWNPLNVKADTGSYRIYAEFAYSGEVISDVWEFEIDGIIENLWYKIKNFFT